MLAGGERCVTDIVEAMDISQSAVSHQLRTLRQMHPVKARWVGKNMLYSLDDDHVQTVLEMGAEHVAHVHW